MAQITIDAPAVPTSVRRGGLLMIIMLGQFMAVLDVTVVNVAAPTIRTDLHASGAGLQLVIAGYTIAYAMLLITGARLGDGRFARSLERTPNLALRLFADHERELPVRSLAARFAAKEALAKALGAPGGLLWHDAEVRRAENGRPTLHVKGTIEEAARRLGITT